MTYREDLIFVTHMKFDFVTGEERERGIITVHTHEHHCSSQHVHSRACTPSSLCVIILLVWKVKGNLDNDHLTQEGQIDHPVFPRLISVYMYVCTV